MKKQFERRQEEQREVYRRIQESMTPESAMYDVVIGVLEDAVGKMTFDGKYVGDEKYIHMLNLFQQKRQCVTRRSGKQ
ncbi:hypothetical protein ACFL3V_03945 [Nanoarchaeota archaeon]